MNTYGIAAKVRRLLSPELSTAPSSKAPIGDLLAWIDGEDNPFAY